MWATSHSAPGSRAMGSIWNEIEFGAGGQRLGCKFLLDDGSLLFVHESQITPEIDSLMASLGSPTDGLTNGSHRTEHPMKRP